jgi:multidrug efflux pump subunit AcrB
MNISAWAIKNPIPSIMLFAMLCIVGVVNFRATNVQDFPDIELPIVTVNTRMEGASPAQMETEVARKIENAVASIGLVKHVHSNISDSQALVTVEFDLSKDSVEAVNDVRDAISRIRGELPGDIKDPIITKANTSGRPILTYSVSSAQMDEQDVSWYVDNDISKVMLTVKGVGRMTRIGGLDREIRVEMDPGKLFALKVSAADVSRQIKRVQQESSGGLGEVSGEQQSVRTLGTVATAGELAAMNIALQDGRRYRLDQLATITDSKAEQSGKALVNGKSVVAFEITRTKGASEITVAKGVRAAVEKLNEAHPSYQITEVVDNVAAVQENFNGSMALLYEGALFAILVVWWFLRDWRATLVAASALPLSIIPTFIGVYYFGFTLNTVTLLALGLVVGILVDDAIVEVENIVRHLQMGKTPYQAAMEATEEIGLAVVATTFTLISVFLPTAFMSGIPGKFFKEFGWTAALAVFASLVVARLLTPLMAAYMLKATGAHVQDGKLMKNYLGWVDWCLSHRKLTTLFTIIFFVGSILMIPLLPKGFVPAPDRAQTQVALELPPGSSLEDTLAAAEKARQIIMSNPDVIEVFSAIGRGASGDLFSFGGGAAEIRKANLSVKLTHRSQRDHTQQVVEKELREQLQQLPGVRVAIGVGNAGEKFVLILGGEDAEVLSATSQAVERELRTLPGLGNVTSSASLLRPEIIIRPDFARMADMGVTAASIAETVRVATAGDYSVALAKLNLPQRQVPIRVMMVESAREDLDMLSRLPVPAKNGNVMLGNVADISMSSGSAQINRLDRTRVVTINIELNGRELGDVFTEVGNLPSMKSLPPGVKRAETGDAERMQELFGSFGLAMLTGVMCVYIVLVLLFKDFLQPVTILAALPLSMGGAFVALLITNSSFSMPSLIGLLVLMGIVTKNSILLVEYAIVARRDHHMARFDALIDACHKRARPIVMTTIAMGAGMLPIAMGLGSDPSFRSPMATAVIGGLITSTLLSLLVVPVVFTYVDDIFQKMQRTFLKEKVQ